MQRGHQPSVPLEPPALLPLNNATRKAGSKLSLQSRALRTQRQDDPPPALNLSWTHKVSP